MVMNAQLKYKLLNKFSDNLLDAETAFRFSETKPTGSGPAPTLCHLKNAQITVYDCLGPEF